MNQLVHSSLISELLIGLVVLLDYGLTVLMRSSLWCLDCLSDPIIIDTRHYSKLVFKLSRSVGGANWHNI